MADKIRVGIIGASVNRGWGWRSHVPGLLALPEYELAAVCTAHEETARGAAGATGARFAYSDFHELMANPEIDLVTVAVRVPWHREMVLAAFEAGKHVYCEWPLGSNLSQVEEMASAARQAGVKAMPGLQARAAPWVLHLKELIDSGYVGRPHSASATLTMASPYMRSGVMWAAQRASGNHILSIQTAHSLDIVSFCLGGLEDVAARIETQVNEWPVPNSDETVPADAPDFVVVNARTGSGAVVATSFAYVPAYGSGWRLEVRGDEGIVVATSTGPPMVAPNRLEGARAGEKDLHELSIPEQLITVPPEIRRDGSFHVAHMYQRLADAINNSISCDPDFDDALALYRLVDVLEKSDVAGGVRIPTAQA
jgi:predicted dehydrogenase